MRSPLRALIECLPFDGRGRRAFDETLLDWAHERRAARTARQRWTVAFRAVVAVTRTFVGVVGRETLDLPYGWLGVYVLVVAALPAGVVVLLAYGGLQPLFALATPAQVVELTALAIPHEAELFVPLAFFFAVAWPRRGLRMPMVGLALVACVGTFAFSGWVEPAANRRFSETANVIWQPAHPRGRFSSTGPDKSIPQMVAALETGPSSLKAAAFKTGLGPLATALVFLAAALEARFRRLRRRLIVLSAFVYLGAVILLTAGAVPFYYVVMSPVLWPWSMAALGIAVVGLLFVLRPRPRWLVISGGLIVVVWSFLPNDWVFLYSVLGAGFAPWVMALLSLIVAIALSRQVARSGPVGRESPVPDHFRATPHRQIAADPERRLGRLLTQVTCNACSKSAG